MPPGAFAGEAFSTGDNAGNDLMAMAGRFLALGLALAFDSLPPAESILNMKRLLEGGKLRYDRD